MRTPVSHGCRTDEASVRVTPTEFVNREARGGMVQCRAAKGRNLQSSKTFQRRSAMKHFNLPFVLVLVFNGFAGAQATQAEAPFPTAQVKIAVQKRGIGEKSRVKVRLRSKAEVKGYISRIEDASFDVTDKSSGQVTTISYATVERVQKDGLSRGAKIGIIVV